MPIKRLNDNAEERFLAEPELFMGVQLGTIAEDLHVILGGKIAVPARPEGWRTLSEAINKILSGEHEAPGFYASPPDAHRNQFSQRLSDWSRGLERNFAEPLKKQSLASLTREQVKAFLAFVRLPAPGVPAPPTPPARIYGHLPFKGVTTSGDAFLRFEPWPTSRRLAGSTVMPGTYAAPISERHLVPNGFAAVGRYALPGLLPACTVWKIAPGTSTPLAVGPCVPAYGQSGGGAEVCFLAGAARATITPETALPVL